MKRDKRKQPRWLQQLRAYLGAYFWLPCPICGEYFGGHEWGDRDTLWETPGEGTGVCANCGDEARRRSVIQERPNGLEVLEDGTWVFHIDAGTIDIGTGGRFGL